MSIHLNSLSEEDFSALLKPLLFRLLEKRSGMTVESINLYLTDENMKQFNKAFTHESFDPINNYEYLETLGDITLNKCVIWYFHRRFPNLKNMPRANKIMTNLKTKNVARDKFSQLAKRLQFQNYIRYKSTEDPKKQFRKSIMDHNMMSDVFEAVMGTLEDVIDTTEKIPCIGATPVYNIVASLLDQDEFSIDLAAVAEPKTQLLQGFKMKKWPDVVFTDRRAEEVTGNDMTANVFYVSVSLSFPHPVTGKEVNIVIPEQRGFKKKDAEKMAARIALDKLKNEFNIIFE
jgi:dsRNA-specific ribonuclease